VKYLVYFRIDLGGGLGHPPEFADLQGIICGAVFEDLLVDPAERIAVLCEAEKTPRIFYRMVEGILTSKEEDERRRQAIEVDG